MIFRVLISTDNAAFEGENRGAELARILRGIVEKLEYGSGHIAGDLRDVNGNKVGRYGYVRPAPKRYKLG